MVNMGGSAAFHGFTGTVTNREPTEGGSPTASDWSGEARFLPVCCPSVLQTWSSK